MWCGQEIDWKSIRTHTWSQVNEWAGHDGPDPVADSGAGAEGTGLAPGSQSEGSVREISTGRTQKTYDYRLIIIKTIR